MFNSCFQLEISPIQDDFNRGFLDMDEKMFAIFYSDNEIIPEIRKSLHLRLISLEGKFSNGSKVYIVLTDNESTLILGPSAHSKDALCWSDLIALNGAQVFIIYGLTDNQLNSRSILLLRHGSESEFSFVATSKFDSDSGVSCCPVILHSLDCEENSKSLQFMINSFPFRPIDIDKSDRNLQVSTTSTPGNSPPASSTDEPKSAAFFPNVGQGLFIVDSEPPGPGDIISFVFSEGSLGLTLRRKSSGVVYVHDIIPATQAVSMDIQPGDEIWSVGNFLVAGQSLDQEKWKSFIGHIRDSSRPITVQIIRRPSVEEESSSPSPSPSPPSLTSTPTSPTTSPLVPTKQLTPRPTPPQPPPNDYALVELCRRLIFKDSLRGRSASTDTGAILEPFVQPGRCLLRCDEVHTEVKGAIWNTMVKKYLILTNDFIVLCQIQGNSYIVENIIDLKTCKLKTNGRGLSGIVPDDSQDSDEGVCAAKEANSFNLLWPLGSLRIYTKSSKDWSEWVKLIFYTICENIPPNLRSIGWRHQCMLGTMHAAVVAGDEDRVRALLQGWERGSLDLQDVDGQDDDGYTPLHYACILGLHEVIRILHEGGADVTVVDRNGLTALHWAALQLDDRSLELLCTHVFNVDIQDQNGLTPLYLACVEGRNTLGVTDMDALVRCIDCLAQAGADVDHRDADGWTMLHYLAASWQHEAVSALIGAGADVHAVSGDEKPNSDGYIPLHLACMRSPLKYATGLSSRLLSATALSSNKYEMEALHDEDLVPTLRALSDGGCSLNFKDATGRAALSLLAGAAESYGLNALVAMTFLLSRGARVEDWPRFCADTLHACFIEDAEAVSQWTQSLNAAINQWASAGLPDYSVDSSVITLNCFMKPDKYAVATPDGVEAGPCRICQTAFSLFRRQHHCRLCCRLCCDDCSRKRVPVAGQSAPVRVCDCCFHRTCKLLLQTRQRVVSSVTSPLEVPISPRTSETSLTNNTAAGAASTTTHATRLLMNPQAIAAKRDERSRSFLFGIVKPRAASKDTSMTTDPARGVGATAAVMSEAKERLHERGEKLSQLADKSADLARASNEFADLAKQLNQQSRWW